MSRKMIDRTGEENYNNEGTLMRIIKYRRVNDIFVEFQDEYKANVHTTYSSFKKGNVKNPFHKSVYSVGYIGIGKYKTKLNGKQTKVYEVWQKMLQRCYDPYYINKYPTYIDCYVCKDWHNFQNFAQWWEDNVYNCNNEKMHLDKDILCKGNKIYSPENCMLVPERINTLFIKCDARRGKYPIGVSWSKVANKFLAQCSVFSKENNKKMIYLGYYNTSEEAFLAYKIFKEKYIKKVADEYKDLIPFKLYESMYSYEVDIND